MSETQIVLIVAGLVVIGFWFFRSMNEERRMRSARKGRLQAEKGVDILAEDAGQGRTEPELKHHDNGDVRDEEGMTPASDDMPSAAPPIYESIAEEQLERIAKEAAEGAAAARRIAGVAQPPVDHGIEWVLDITPYEGKSFPIGALDSLIRQLQQLSLPLPHALWGKSKTDGLYYPAEWLPGEAVHLVATIVIANRAAVLDDVTASSFLQLLEQTAAQNDVDVRMSCDMSQAIATAGQIARFIRYFDKMLEVVIVPGATEEGLKLDNVTKLAEASGFVSGSGRWEYFMDVDAKEPVMTLSYANDGSTKLRLAFDVPLSSLSRGDLKRFFQLANHLANHLNGVWVDGAGNRIEAAGALMLQDEIEARAAQMATSGVRAGSDRARLLFSRCA